MISTKSETRHSVAKSIEKTYVLTWANAKDITQYPFEACADQRKTFLSNGEPSFL